MELFFQGLQAAAGVVGVGVTIAMLLGGIAWKFHNLRNRLSVLEETVVSVQNELTEHKTDQKHDWERLIDRLDTKMDKIWDALDNLRQDLGRRRSDD